MTDVTPADVLTAHFSTLARAGVTAAAAQSWNPDLNRAVRVEVPIDVQAFVVPAGQSAPRATVLSPLPDPVPDGSTAAPPSAPPVPPFTDGPVRPPGVYLHWAAADALAAAGPTSPPGTAGARGAVASQPLPDRWLVVRVAGGTPRRTRRWVVAAERGLTVDLASWSEAGTTSGGRTPHLSAEKLTVLAGGDPAWAAVYDTAEDRFAMHDPLDDLTADDLRGTVSYLVCGWWSADADDPLYAAGTAERATRLAAYRWTYTAAEPAVQAAKDLAAQRGGQLGLATAAGRSMTSVDTAGGAAAAQAAASPRPDLAAAAGSVLTSGSPPQPQLTLVHGSVLGVRLTGPLDGEDDQPLPASIEVAVGASGTEAFAALLALDQPADQRVADERLVAAFCAGLIAQLDAPDGLVTLDQQLHAAEFIAQPGGPAGTDRLLAGDRVAAARASAGAQQSAAAQARASVTKASVIAAERGAALLAERTAFDTIGAHEAKNPPPAAAPQLTPRDRAVAAPAWHLPADPVVTLRAVNRALRHGHNGRFTVDGTLACRVSGQERTAFAGLVAGAELVAPLGNGGLPPECDDLLRELVLDDVSQLPQTAAYAAAARGLPANQVTARLTAEHALRWDVPGDTPGKDLLRAASLWQGTEPSPLAVTPWRQPWIPLFLEWELALRVDNRTDRWRLAEVDLDPAPGASPDPGAGTAPLVLRGRVLLTSAVAKTFANQVDAFAAAESQRGTALAVLRPDEEAALRKIAEAGARFDVLTGGLAGLREQLLGLAWADAGRVSVDRDGNRIPPAPAGPPLLLRGGVASFTRMRVVDAFGRSVDIPPSSITGAAVAERLQPPPQGAQGPDAQPPQLMLRPRLTRPSRLELTFADPAAADTAVPGPATVNQVDPAQQVSPVCGWLLPDHLDGSLEVFDAAARQLGTLLEDIDGRVVWEGAPGLPGPAGAPPAALPGDDAGTRHVVRLAAGVVAADAAARNAAGSGDGAPDGGQPAESALSALLRTVDTTLWTVDPFGTTGTEYVASLTGRPIAVVMMTVLLNVRDDLGAGPDAELTLRPADLARRQAAYDELASRQIPVRLGELTRTDDGVLGYFVDGDYSRFTPVSPEVLAAARAGGRYQGQLAVLGANSAGDPAPAPVDHPFVDDTEQPLTARPGQLVRLTVLLVPGGSAHATCGLLPRVSVQLARDWTADALRALLPSIRTGPLLLDPSTVRLPKITGLPATQVFTARTTETTWADSPVTAATHDALLPDDPPVFRDGWIRAAQPAPDGTGTSANTSTSGGGGAGT